MNNKSVPGIWNNYTSFFLPNHIIKPFVPFAYKKRFGGISTFCNLIFKRRSIAGSLIGGLKETQEMLDFCAEHKITSDIEIIPIQAINKAYDRILKSDVKYRFVIDLASLQDQ